MQQKGFVLNYFDDRFSGFSSKGKTFSGFILSNAKSCRFSLFHIIVNEIYLGFVVLVGLNTKTLEDINLGSEKLQLSIFF